MHVVVCPNCHLKSTVARAVVSARMKCNRCGKQFFGSSVESPQAPRPASPVQAAPVGAAPPMPVRPAPRSAAGPIMLVITCVAAVGIIVLLGIFIYIRTHPTVEVRLVDPKTGEVVGRRSGDDTDLRQLAAPTRMPEPTPAPAEQAQRGPVGDPKLEVSCKVVEAGSVGEQYFARGRVLSKYDVALEWIEVTAHLPNMPPIGRRFSFVPAGAALPYSVRLPPGRIDEAALKVVARCRPVAKGTVVWSIPAEELRPLSPGPGWTGRTRNPSDAPVEDVKIIVDYFDRYGVHCGAATGKLEDKDALGAGKLGRFRVSATGLGVELASEYFARAVGKRY